MKLSMRETGWLIWVMLSTEVFLEEKKDKTNPCTGRIYLMMSWMRSRKLLFNWLKESTGEKFLASSLRLRTKDFADHAGLLRLLRLLKADMPGRIQTGNLKIWVPRNSWTVGISMAVTQAAKEECQPVRLITLSRAKEWFLRISILIDTSKKHVRKKENQEKHLPGNKRSCLLNTTWRKLCDMVQSLHQLMEMIRR